MGFLQHILFMTPAARHYDPGDSGIAVLVFPGGTIVRKGCYGDLCSEAGGFCGPDRPGIFCAGREYHLEQPAGVSLSPMKKIGLKAIA